MVEQFGLQNTGTRIGEKHGVVPEWFCDSRGGGGGVLVGKLDRVGN